jgi:hypothetical protein
LVIITGIIQEAGIVQPGGPGHLPVAVESEPSRQYRVERLFVAGKNGGNTSAHRAYTRLESAIAGDQLVWPTSTPLT